MNRVSPELDSSPSALDQSIEAATRALLALQQRDGHWVFELEADATIPAEYVLLRHYLDEPVDTVLEAKIAAYLRRIQGDHGGWPLFHEGAFDMSASVKAYFALKMIGDGVDATHMVRARAAIRARDLEVLGLVAEHSALKMHAVGMGARPPLLYWRGATVDCLDRVWKLRAEGTPAFATIDAGPQVKVLCAPGDARRVAEALRAVPGVERVLACAPGVGAEVVA